MRFEVLGPLRVLDGGREVTPAGQLQQVLLACLLSRLNTAVHPDRLAAAAWPEEQTGDPTGRLQVHVHRLRKVLDDPGRLVHGPGGYVLRAEPEEVDAWQFDSLTDAAFRPGVPESDVIDLAVEARSLWRGTAYAGIGCEDVALEADRLAERYVAVSELQLMVELNTDNHSAVLPELQRLAAQHPLRERLQGLLITGLYRAGRQAEALEHYQRTRSHLVEELGVEPGPELRGVHALVLSGAPMPTRPVAPSPAQLPADLGCVLGREPEVSALDEAVASGARAVLVSGMAGVGKTTLALHWAHARRGDFPDGQLHVDLRGFSPQSPREPGPVLDAWLRALGVPPEQIPADTEDRSGVLRSRLTDRRVLLVIDNAADAEQVRPLLPGTPGSLAIITGRHALTGLVTRDDAAPVRLDVLREEHALAILSEGTAALPRETLARMAARCGHLPLALRMLAERLRAAGDRAADLLDELDDDEGRLDVLGGTGDPSADVRAVLHWSYRHLGAEARSMLHHVGVHPAGRSDPAELAALADTDTRTARRAADLLVAAHLVAGARDGRLTQHDLLADYTRELAAGALTAADRARALERLVRYLATTACRARDVWVATGRPCRPDLTADRPAPFDDPAEAVAWVDVRRGDLVDVVRAVAREAPRAAPDLVSLARAVVPILLTQGHLWEAWMLGESALAVGGSGGEEEAVLRLNLGSVLATMGRTREAIRLTGRALEQLRDAGADAHAATAVLNLACFDYDLGMLHACTERAQEALELMPANSAHPHRGRALAVLGRALVDLGHAGTDQLVAGLQAARAVAGHEEEAFALLAAGEACMVFGRRDEARDHADRLRLLTRRPTLRLAVPGALRLAGEIELAAGDPSAARPLLTDALTAARAIGHTSEHVQALNALGRIDRSEGAPGLALARHFEALALASRSAAQAGVAHSYLRLGHAHEDLGDLTHAAWDFALAVQAYDRCGFAGPERTEASRRFNELVRARPDTCAEPPAPSAARAARAPVGRRPS